MKYIIALLVIISLNSITKAQTSVDKGRVQLKVAKGIYLGSILSSYHFNESGSLQNGGATNFGAFQNRLTLHYNTHKNFSLGIDFLGHSAENVDTVYNSGGLGVIAQYYIVNKPKMNVYIEANMGGLNFNWGNKEETNPASISGRGSYNSFSIGLNKYFGNILGLYGQVGYMGQGIRVDTFTHNGNTEEYLGNIKAEDVKFLMRGGYANIGLTIKLRNKSPKSE
ncbi:MAG: hypothetical protein N4A35_04000 [Flavobacteriales bacterium]|jgi:hypothetical protein|nr:hypothetical protein [Flavobacteriales bacterium]